MCYKLIVGCLMLLISSETSGQIRVKSKQDIHNWIEKRTLQLKDKFSTVYNSIHSHPGALETDTKNAFSLIAHSQGMDTNDIYVIYVNNPCFNVNTIPFVNKDEKLLGVCFEVNTGFSTYVFLLAKIFKGLITQQSPPEAIIYNNRDFYFQILKDFGADQYYNSIRSRLDTSRKEDRYLSDWLPIYFATMVLDVASRPEMLIDTSQLTNDPDQTEELFVYGMLTFMYCHEISHLLLQHYKDQNSETSFARENSADSLGYKIFNEIMRIEITFEDDVDTSAINLYRAFTAAAPVLFFGWFDHLQKFERKYFNIHRGNKHPIGAERRKNLLLYYKKENNNTQGKFVENKLIEDFFSLQNFILEKLTKEEKTSQRRRQLRKIAACSLY